MRVLPESASSDETSARAARTHMLSREFASARLAVRACVGRLLLSLDGDALADIAARYEDLELAAGRAASFARLLSQEK